MCFLSLTCLLGCSHFCGLATVTPQQCGARSVFCPTGSSAPQDAGDGNYTEGSADGKKQTKQTPCNLGNYCQAGEMKPCKTGTHASSRGLSVCGDCPSGTITASDGEVNCASCNSG